MPHALRAKRPGAAPRHNRRHADSSPHRPRRAANRPCGRALVWPDLPGRLWPVHGLRRAALAPCPVCAQWAVELPGRGGHPFSGCFGCGAGRALGLLPVLQPRLLRSPPAGNFVCLARRHEFSWRHAGRHRRDGLVCLRPPARFLGGGRFRGALRTHRPGLGAHRQLY